MVSFEGQCVKWTDGYHIEGHCASFEDRSVCDEMSRVMVTVFGNGDDLIKHVHRNTSAGQQTASPLFLQHARHNDQGRSTPHQLHCSSE